LLVLAAHAWPEGFSRLGLDFGRLGSDLRRLPQEAEREQALEDLWASVQRSVALKKQIATALVARRITLFEAARQFRELPNATLHLELGLAHTQGDSEGERLCRYVIGWVEETFRDQPAKARDAVAQLEADLQAYLAAKKGPKKSAMLQRDEPERVALTEDLPDYGLKRGDIGTVVMVHAASGYEVEFVPLSGDTLAVVSLFPRQVRALGRREIAHARQLEVA
jgi:hypothetical protein